jgi:hypothetical protein
MKTIFLSFPRLSVSLTAPDYMLSDIRFTFRHAIVAETPTPPLHQYAIHHASHSVALIRNGRMEGTFGSLMEALIHLEEVIEVLLIKAVDDWAAFHAGAVENEGAGWLIAGNPDTGKTTTTFNLIEMGALFLCEEVSPVDPVNCLIHPYPQILTMSRRYAEAYRSDHAVNRGELILMDEEVARYAPHQAGSDPVRLHVILLPAYDPDSEPAIEVLSPEAAFTELLGYAFPPTGDDEDLFDAVINICERSRIFRLRANSLQATRTLLTDLTQETSKPRTLNR